MTRKQGMNLVKKYDGAFPEKYVDLYLEYFGLTGPQFDEIIDKWANKELFEKSEWSMDTDIHARLVVLTAFR